MLSGRDPAVMIDSADSAQLEVLGVVLRQRVGIFDREGVGHARTCHRGLKNSVHGLRLWNPGNIKNRECDVDSVRELCPQASAIFDPIRP